MILVTGGAGFIGSHALHRLQELGQSAVALDNFSTGHRWAVPAGTELVEGDIADQALVERVVRSHKVQAVIHFAAKLAVEESVREPFQYYRNNVSGSLNLIEACARNGVDKFIFSSTCALYGNTTKNPISEDFPTGPVSPYASSKLMTERILADAEASGKYPLRHVALRYFNVAGARVQGGLGQATPNATQLVKVAAEAACGKRAEMRIFGTDYDTPDGTCVRDYIHVDDLVDLHVAALEYLRDGGKSNLFNCGYGRGYSVREVIAAMKRVSGVDFKVREEGRRAGDVVAVWAESSKVRSVLKWQPRYDDLDLICRTAYVWEKSYKPAL